MEIFSFAKGDNNEESAQSWKLGTREKVVEGCERGHDWNIFIGSDTQFKSMKVMEGQALIDA